MANWQIGKTGMAGTNTLSRFYGLHTIEYGGETAADRTLTVQRLAAAGAKWVRVNCLWLYMQPDSSFRGTLNAGAYVKYDDFINKIRAAGMDVLLLSTAPAPWAYGANSNEGDPTLFAEYATLLANHYKGLVAGYQVFNEVDVNWTSASNYATVLKTSYPNFKAVDPSAKVVMSGLTYNLSNPGGTATYLQSLYSLGIAGYLDIMSPHLYPQFGHETYLGPYLDSLKTVMTNNGDNSNIWVTEFGYPSATGFGTQADQVTFVNNFVPIIYSKSYIKRMVWYELIDHTATDTDKEHNFGVYLYDGTPKPVRDLLPTFL